MSKSPSRVSRYSTADYFVAWALLSKSGCLESFAEAYFRCREDFEGFLHDWLQDLNPALIRL